MASHGVPRTSARSGGLGGKGREAQLQKIQEYRILVDNVNTKMHEKDYTTEVLQLTTQLLEWNPEYYTIWNHRRRLLRHFFAHGNNNKDSDESDRSHIQQHLTTDLTFLIPLLRKFPKCYWIWNYRLWLLSEASRLLPPPTTYKLWQQELALVGKMLGIDSRNFHGWGYRRKVVAAMEELSSEIDALSTDGGSMTEAEFEYTTRMIKNNLSNFSAWHRRSKLIPKLLDERNASFDQRCRFLDEEFQLVQRALYADPDSKDQSLWSYHQYLVTSFAPSPSPSPSHLPTSTTPPILPSLPPAQKLTNLKNQISDLLEMLDGAEDSKWIYQRLVEMALMGRALDEGGRWPVGGEAGGEGEVVEGWVRRLGVLDPLRKGKWEELGGRVRGLGNVSG